MNRYAFLAAVTILVVPGVALAQGGSMSQSSGQGGNGAQFQARKNEILQRINHHISELQQRQSCVQAATTREALKACMPQHQEQGQGQGQGQGQR